MAQGCLAGCKKHFPVAGKARGWRCSQVWADCRFIPVSSAFLTWQWCLETTAQPELLLLLAGGEPCPGQFTLCFVLLEHGVASVPHWLHANLAICGICRVSDQMPCLAELLLPPTMNLKHPLKAYELKSPHMVHANIRISEMKIYKLRPPPLSDCY